MSSGKIVLGALAGLAAGAVLGILFAPEKGSRTRKKISNMGQDYAADITDKFNDFIEVVNDKFETIKDEFHKVKHTAEKVEKDLKSAKG